MHRHVVISGLAAAAQLMNLRLVVSASSSAAFIVHQPIKLNYRHRYSVAAAATRRLHSTRLLSTSKQEQAGSVCDVDSAIQVPDLVTNKGSAAILRKAILQNVDGDNVLLGERMGTTDTDNTSIIVFLRHLA